MEDLKAHETLRTTPLTYNYGGNEGVTLHECPPNGQGITALIALGIVEALEESGVVDLTSVELNSAEWLHTLIEATRLAFADTRALVGCPDVMQKEIIDKLLSRVSFCLLFCFALHLIAWLTCRWRCSQEYLAERAKLFDPEGSSPIIRKGIPHASSDTVLFSVTDKSGSAISYIQSNYVSRLLARLANLLGTIAIPSQR